MIDVDLQSRAEEGERSSRAIGIGGICVSGVGLALVLAATLVAGLDTGSSFVGPTDSEAIAILTVGALFLLVSFGLSLNAIATPLNRRNGIVALAVTVSPLVFVPVSLLILDAFVT